jgi:hypothetical protein
VSTPSTAGTTANVNGSSGLRIRRVSHVELNRQQIVVFAHCGCDLRSIAASCDNRMARRQSGLGHVDAQTASSAGYQPHFLFTHGTPFNSHCEASSSSIRLSRHRRGLQGVMMTFTP